MNLDTWMRQQSLGNEDLARALGLSGGYVGRVRHGKVNPTLATALAIYDYTKGKIDLRSLVPPRLTVPAPEPIPVNLNKKLSRKRVAA